MVKFKLFMFVPAVVLILAGCSSDPEQVAFNKWKQDTYKVESLSYDNSELKLEAQQEVKPVLDSVNKIIPSGRFKVNVDILKDDSWKRKLCKKYVDVAGDQILEPLKEPVLGNYDSFTVAGFASLKQFKDIAKELNVEVAESPDNTGILEGSNAEYPYAPTKYVIAKDTGNFNVILTADSGWNALFWEEYYAEEDPGKMDTKDFPLPSDEYMPLTVEVFFKPACEKL